jgi:nicotinate dehydrogenase subunit A
MATPAGVARDPEVWEGSSRAPEPFGPRRAGRPGVQHRTADEEVVMATVKLTVDGKRVSINAADPNMPLLYALRNDLGLNNPHFGCGLAQCGACTVHLDGEPVRACILPLSVAQGKTVTTLKGLGSPQKPHALQQAFVEEQVPQCGYCVNGWIMTAAAVLRKKPKATDGELREALAGLKCRCGTHVAILRAIKRAQAMLA